VFLVTDTQLAKHGRAHNAEGHGANSSNMPAQMRFKQTLIAQRRQLHQRRCRVGQDELDRGNVFSCDAARLAAIDENYKLTRV
jgi:hypothetical protein